MEAWEYRLATSVLLYRSPYRERLLAARNARRRGEFPTGADVSVWLLSDDGARHFQFKGYVYGPDRRRTHGGHVLVQRTGLGTYPDDAPASVAISDLWVRPDSPAVRQ